MKQAELQGVFSAAMRSRERRRVAVREKLVLISLNESRKFRTDVVDFVASKASKTHRDQ